MRSDLFLSPDVVLAVLWSVICWVAGVAFAAYRAVTWVARMRAWAASVTTTTTEGNP